MQSWAYNNLWARCPAENSQFGSVGMQNNCPPFVPSAICMTDVEKGFRWPIPKLSLQSPHAIKILCLKPTLVLAEHFDTSNRTGHEKLRRARPSVCTRCSSVLVSCFGIVTA